jgi:Sec-independent protein translocase protein TatA
MFVGLSSHAQPQCLDRPFSVGIVEIFLFLLVAIIVIPPDHLPEVMRTVGKILRELRLASNTVVRELSGAMEDPPYMHRRPESPELTVEPQSPPITAEETASTTPVAEPPEAPQQ